jgi:hypothetical protein
VAPYCSAAPGSAARACVHRFANAGDVEHGAVRKAAGKADDAGLAQQLEQLADGGGFDVVEALGEGKAHGGT